ncbi:MAG: molybdopterin synthase sulfur carrier subunit [Chloroflexi bacterium]|nr:molybdopterin synthase sulfur carrier subunit [Chloroflexota bacterium]
MRRNIVSVTINIPTPLRSITNSTSELINGSTLIECLNNLDEKFRGIKNRLIDKEGEVNKFINIYINGEDIRFSDGLNTKVKSDSVIDIVPSMAGG